MPAPKKTRRKPRAVPAPIVISFKFLLEDDGSIIATYEGTDARTHAVGKAVLASIALAYDFDLTRVA